MIFRKLIVILLIFSFTFTANAGKICRSRSVKHAFDVSQGYPKGRKGYVVDHICALANGGLDIVSNMQYQTIEASRAKDKIENKPIGKLLYCNYTNSRPIRAVFNCK